MTSRSRRARGHGSEVIQYEVNDGVATIWLNRPEVKNCVNWELLTSLGAALERAEEDDDVRVVADPRPRQHVLRRRRPEHARLASSWARRTTR